MIKGKLLLVFCILLTLGRLQTLHAQSGVAIVLNEYAATNTTGPTDNYGVLSDWVEILNAHTSPVNLGGYYLSNDRFNLFKWKIPSTFSLTVGEMKIVWLSGRNNSANGSFHANFTLDQCKNQWLILTTPAGVVRDSVFVQKTKAGHTRGRVDVTNMGLNFWKLYTTHSWMQPNPIINNYIDYVPKPSIFPTNPTGTVIPLDSTAKINPGIFQGDAAGQIFKVKINGYDYDTINFPCYDIFYTTNGDYPTPANGKKYIDFITDGIIMANTGMLRVVAWPTLTGRAGRYGCPTGYLDSFCETNTYFIDPDHQLFDEHFGVVSMALDIADAAWFDSQGSPPSTTVHVEYYDKKKQVSEGYAILNRPSNESWQTKQRGYYVSIDDRYGFGCNFEGNVFNVADMGTSTRTVFPTLHMKAGDYESNSAANGGPTGKTDGTALRDVLIQTLAAKNNINVSPLHVKPVVAFVNGKYWGVYNLTEVFDKFYENYYYGQDLNQLDMCFYHNGDASVSYPDGSVSTYSNNYKSAIYNEAFTKPLSVDGPGQPYTKIMAQVDKSSLIDYMILNSYTMNSDLWNLNIAFAKGSDASKPGGKWHYYLWNMPSIFNFTSQAITSNTITYTSCQTSPCYIQNISGYAISPKGHNAHGAIFNYLMNSNKGNAAFQAEYRNRYMDLLNGPLKCENILKHLKMIDTIYQKEMRCHEDAGCTAGPGTFVTTKDIWDTNMVRLRKLISCRCYYMEKAFNTPGCFGVKGPYPITVDVTPAGSGKVKLNSNLIENYVWSGNYFATKLQFEAIPTNTNYAFHHWEFKNHTPVEPISQSTVSVLTFTNDDVIAVFTDKSNNISVSGDGANIPSGFTPNGDGLNDYFRPLGSSAYMTDYQMTIWNRWGQEVYRSTDPTSIGWDGNFNGQKAVTGVYAFVITYKNVYSESKVAKGNVTLTR